MAEVIAGIYEKYEKIGSGGGGKVYRGKHIRLNKDIVLKVYKHNISSDPESVGREVAVLKELSHSYIPNVYDYFEYNGEVYTVMDYIDGVSLDVPLKEGKRFSQPQVIVWAKQLLEALDYLHSPIHGEPPRGFVHSDIKPANIMLTKFGNICLIDFNISLALGEENIVGLSAGYASPEHYGLDYSSESSSTGMTDAETANKTVLINENNTSPANSDKSNKTEIIPHYMPEMPVKKTIIPDVRSDIYSLGATLYHFLSGVRPAKSALNVKPLSETEFSPQIVKIITKAMNPNPDLRYQSASEMLYDFEHLRDPHIKKLKHSLIISELICALLLAAGVFAAFTGLKRMEISENRLKLTEYSRTALYEGNAELAVDYALQALPDKTGIFSPEPFAETQYALSGAAGIYNLSDGFKPYKNIELEAVPLCMAVSPSGKTFSIITLGCMLIIDSETGEELARLSTVDSALCKVEYIDEKTIVFTGKDGVSKYDIPGRVIVWTGEKASYFSISADRNYIAAIYNDADYANIYNAADGNIIYKADFGGKKTKAYNNQFKNIHNDLFALNKNGTLLAVSFSEGSITVFDLEDPKKNIEIFGAGSGYTHFEGGFYGDYLAFSAVNSSGSDFAVIDCKEAAQTGGFSSERYYSVITDETGIYVHVEDQLEKFDPETEKAVPLIATSESVQNYELGGNYTLISTDSRFEFYNKNAEMISGYDTEYPADFLKMSGDTAVIGFSNSKTVRILKLENHQEKEIFTYDPSYVHTETRISMDGQRVMLFSIYSFRVYSINGELINETEIPDSDKIYDQQYIRKNGESTLEVTYYDGRKFVYSSEDGALIRTETVEKPSKSLYEEFYTDKLRIESPLHETPCAYDIKTNEKIAELDKDSYLTYITQAGNYIIAQYTTTGNYYYGVLMNEKCEPLAELPYLCDVIDENLIFDYLTGNVRESRIYTLSELIKTAREK